MSAGGLARLGVRCADASTGMATLGIFCAALAGLGAGAELGTRASSGAGKRRSSMRYTPGISSNRHLAMLEDEELLIMLQAYFVSKRKH